MLAPLGAALIASCTRATPTERIRLLAPAGGAVADRCVVDGDSREAQRLEAGEETRIRLRVPAGAVLRYAAATPAAAPAELALTVTALGSDVAVHDAVAATGRWRERTIDLAPVAGREAEVVARAGGGPLCWGAPAVVGAVRGPSLVVVVLLDTVRADHLSLLGYGRPTTPALERLAHDAVTFTDAAADVSWTRGSVATLMTGEPSMVHGVLGRDALLDAAYPTMAELLRARGFRTVALSTNPNVLPVWGFARGFDQFVDVDAEEWTANADAGRVLAVARDTVQAAEREPLFLYVHVNDAHAPYDPPLGAARRLLGAYSAEVPGRNLTPSSDAREVAGAVDRYDAEIASLDAHLGAFFAFLGGADRWRESLVVVVGDHGEEFRDHGGIYHGHTLFREQLHVPLLIKLPALAGGGTRVDTAASVVDVLPTMLDLLGAPAADLPGRVLVDGRGRALPGSSLPRFATTALDDAEVYAVDDAATTLIIETHPTPSTWLFDRTADPRQRRNLADREPERAAGLRRLLDDRLVAHRRGWHVRVCGGADSTTVRLRISGMTSGAVERIGLEPEDRVEVAADGKTVFLTSHLRPQQRQEEFFGKLIRRPRPDTDELVFADGAALELAFAGPAVPVGRGLTPPGTAAAPLVAVSAAQALVPPVYVPTCPDAPAVLVWKTGPVAAAEHVDPTILDRLKALGYAH